MSEPKDAMVGFKLTERQHLELERGASLAGTTVSEFIRSAVLPAARDRIVAHAIEAPMGDGA